MDTDLNSLVLVVRRVTFLVGNLSASH